MLRLRPQWLQLIVSGPSKPSPTFALPLNRGGAATHEDRRNGVEAGKPVEHPNIPMMHHPERPLHRHGVREIHPTCRECVILH
jgi:hypothetical protein